MIIIVWDDDDDCIFHAYCKKTPVKDEGEHADHEEAKQSPVLPSKEMSYPPCVSPPKDIPPDNCPWTEGPRGEPGEILPTTGRFAHDCVQPRLLDCVGIYHVGPYGHAQIITRQAPCLQDLGGGCNC